MGLAAAYEWSLYFHNPSGSKHFHMGIGFLFRLNVLVICILVTIEAISMFVFVFKFCFYFYFFFYFLLSYLLLAISCLQFANHSLVVGWLVGCFDLLGMTAKLMVRIGEFSCKHAIFG